MIVQSKNGKTLYAVAFSKRLRSVRTGRYFWKPGFIEYTHATSDAEARNIISRTTPARIDIVAAAPAVGFFVKDNHGEQLSAT